MLLEAAIAIGLWEVLRSMARKGHGIKSAMAMLRQGSAAAKETIDEIRAQRDAEQAAAKAAREAAEEAALASKIASIIIQVQAATNSHTTPPNAPT